jgi:tryptophan halogenase
VSNRIASIGVVGGGTAGYFAALALKRAFPDVAITIIESPRIPIIGVGEATTTLMPPFLHAELGLDIVELWNAVRPTFKLGIHFDWGEPAPYAFAYPFGDAEPAVAAAIDGDLARQSLSSLLMRDRCGPIVRADGAIVSLLEHTKLAYHLDNAPFVRFLASAARARGIAHVAMTIDDVRVRADGNVDALVGDGREVRCDFYVDASGFGSRLLERALGTPFTSYASSLFCDRAIVATVPRHGAIDPYTTAETMDAGWCWRIPVALEDHRGYVHASSAISEDAAIAEMRAKNPGMAEPWTVRFRSGRHTDFWRGNVAAIGNAYAFVEPLESTALHMVIVEIAYLRAGLAKWSDVDARTRFVARANASVGAHWDHLRWFLAVHYKFNRRLDTPFWRAAREGVDIGELAHAIARYEEEGPAVAREGGFLRDDPTFGATGLVTMLLGQRVPHRGPVPSRAAIDAFERTSAEQMRTLRSALPHAECLEVLGAMPELLRAFASSPRSWCAGDRERLRVRDDGGGATIGDHDARRGMGRT